MPNLQRLQVRLGHRFSDESLLRLALTHRSFGDNNNERFEFLGDALLNSIITRTLFVRFPDEQEGVLSRLRSSLVKGEVLAEIAREFSLGECLIMGEGELKSGGLHRDSILADAVEALIGAVFVDADMAGCEALVYRIFEKRVKKLSVDKYLKDPKTRLQELLQSRQLPLPEYSVVTVEGKAHDQRFTVSCDIALLKENTSATASSRRQAEKLAAEKALRSLGE